MGTPGAIVRDATTGKWLRDATTGKIKRFNAAGECPECCGTWECYACGTCCYSSIGRWINIPIPTFTIDTADAGWISLPIQSKDVITSLINWLNANNGVLSAPFFVIFAGEIVWRVSDSDVPVYVNGNYGATAAIVIICNGGVIRYSIRLDASVVPSGSSQLGGTIDATLNPIDCCSISVDSWANNLTSTASTAISISGGTGFITMSNSRCCYDGSICQKTAHDACPSGAPECEGI